jgi:hypothetical protein
MLRLSSQQQLQSKNGDQPSSRAHQASPRKQPYLPRRKLPLLSRRVLLSSQEKPHPPRHTPRQDSNHFLSHACMVWWRDSLIGFLLSNPLLERAMLIKERTPLAWDAQRRQLWKTGIRASRSNSTSAVLPPTAVAIQHAKSRNNGTALVGRNPNKHPCIHRNACLH